MSKVHRRQKSQSVSCHRIAAEGASKRHHSGKHFHTISNNNKMLSVLISIQTEQTDLAYEGGRQFQQQNENGGTGHGCALLDLLSAGLSYKHIPKASVPVLGKSCSLAVEQQRPDCRVTKQPQTVPFVQGEGEALSALPGLKGTQGFARANRTHAPAATHPMHGAHREYTNRDKGREESLCNQLDKRLSRASAQWIEEAHFTRDRKSVV